MLDHVVPMNQAGRREGDILQQVEGNDLSCLVVLVAVDCCQMGDSVHILVQEVHILDVMVAVYRLVWLPMVDSCCSLELPVEDRVEEEHLQGLQGRILVH